VNNLSTLRQPHRASDFLVQHRLTGVLVPERGEEVVEIPGEQRRGIGRQVRRGDIIVFRYPVHPTQHFVKRVVGVPGDRVRLINRQVYVNGNPLQEPYVRYTSSAHDAFRDEFPRLNLPVPGLEGGWWLEMKKLVEDGELIIPQGNYFVLGDNRDESLDSRYWGFVPQENVIGRPLLIYWSIRNEGQDIPLSPTPGDKLYHFVYAATHLLQMTRWDRTFRIVK